MTSKGDVLVPAPPPPRSIKPILAAKEERTSNLFLSQPGEPYDTAELQRKFIGMSARDVYALLCKRIGCKAISSVVAMLPEKPGVWDTSELDLSRTYVGHRGVVAVMELTKLMPQLTSLDLSQNWLTNQSVWHICKVVAYHPSIMRINFSSNDISWTAGMCILELVTHSVKIQEIGLNATLLKPNVIEAIHAQIRRNMVVETRHKRRGPNPSNHPATIRQRALKRFFRDLLLREDDQKLGQLPRKFCVDGLKECMKLMGREQEIARLSPEFLEHFLRRVSSESVDWECFMIIVMLEDVTYNPTLVEELRNVFKYFDFDDAGFLEFRQLHSIMERLNGGIEPSPAEVTAKMAVFNADEAMTMNWDEFLLLMYDRGPTIGELASLPPLRTRSLRTLHH